MPKPGNFISYQSSLMHYAKAGSGPTALLVFPGFGQDYAVFSDWADTLGTTYTLYLFDLFYHGRSTWQEQRPLEKSDWAELMSRFLQQEKIQRFDAAGYSLGGKFALATAEAFSERLNRLILLAPDGIKLNFWYRLATSSVITRAFLKSMILSPANFMGISAFLRRTGALHGGILRFAESQMDTEEKRRRVYHTWVYFRKMKFDAAKVAYSLNANRSPVQILMGRYDKIIPMDRIKPLASRLHSKEIILLDAGHNQIVSLAAPYLNMPSL